MPASARAARPNSSPRLGFAARRSSRAEAEAEAERKLDENGDSISSLSMSSAARSAIRKRSIFYLSARRTRRQRPALLLLLLLQAPFERPAAAAPIDGIDINGRSIIDDNELSKARAKPICLRSISL